MRENPTGSFGYRGPDGQYSGMVGELQREEAELCMLLAPTAPRFEVIDYLRLEPADTFVIVSLKPTLLPAHLSLLTPFTSLYIVQLGCRVDITRFSSEFVSRNGETKEGSIACTLFPKKT